MTCICIHTHTHTHTLVTTLHVHTLCDSQPHSQIALTSTITVPNPTTLNSILHIIFTQYEFHVTYTLDTHLYISIIHSLIHTVCYCATAYSFEAASSGVHSMTSTETLNVTVCPLITFIHTPSIGLYIMYNIKTVLYDIMIRGVQKNIEWRLNLSTKWSFGATNTP